MKIAAFLFILCTIGGFVIAGLNIRILVILGQLTQTHDVQLHCDSYQISGKQLYNIAIVTTILHIVVNAMYFGFYVWIMKLSNEGFAEQQIVNQAPFTVLVNTIITYL